MTRFLTPSASALRPGLALAIALWGLLGSPESAATVSIRVLLLRGVPFAEVSSRGRLRVYSLGEARLLHETDGESPVGLRAQGGRLILSDRGERPLPAGGVRLRAVEESIRLNGAAYRGAIDAAASREGLRVVNVVRLEDYLRGVVGREVPARWPQAALQAQAVAARTFALLLRGRAERAASGPAFSHLTAGTGDQVYGGIAAEDPAVDAAVRSTEGLVLTHRGAMARTFFHAASGGHTEAARAVWPGIDDPYLQGVPVPAEREDPDRPWEARVELEELRRRLLQGGYPVGRVLDIQPDGRTPSGRVARVRILHRDGDLLLLPAPILRRTLGYDRLRSTLFAVGRRGNVLWFRGRGYGHGVGMSQRGARLLAEGGMGYAEILAFFYPGTSIQRVEEAAFPEAEWLLPPGADNQGVLPR